LPKPNEPSKAGTAEEAEDEALKEEEERKKARKRKRGPYRKSHANW
jgi:hypothetical protein